MGNSISKNTTTTIEEEDPKDLPLGETLDYIATHYILTMDFQSMKNMYKKDYCEKLVILTGDIINKYFNDLEVGRMAQRIENNGAASGENPEKVIFFKKTDIEHLNIPDFHKKQMVCNKIAKFYIKIAHLFSAIVTTINPEYVYKDMFGKTIKKGLYEKDNIPKWAKVEVLKLNLCDNRINALEGRNMEKIIEGELSTPGLTWGGGNEYSSSSSGSSSSSDSSSSDSSSSSGSSSSDTTEEQEQKQKQQQEQKQQEQKQQEQKQQEQEQQQQQQEKPAGDPAEPDEPTDPNKDVVIKIQPNICSVNIKENGRLKTLEDEPGIPELMELYYDDEYDYKTGKMTGMSEPTKIQFQSDLKRFYNEFTGNDEMPDNITKFSDIKLKDYSKKAICLAKNKGVEVSYSDQLFVDYAANLKQMIKAVNKKQQQLLAQINKIFVYTQSGLIKINPELTEQSLQKVVDETRNIIIDLYLKCEADFVEGVKLYEAMVESLIFNSTKNQIESLQRASEMLYSTA